MPTVAADPLDVDNYPNLNQLDLKQVLKTHILGREGKYLTPAKQFLGLYTLPEQKWFNVYFDYEIHPGKMANLSLAEYKSLESHCNP